MKVILNPQQMHELIVHDAFQDMVPGTTTYPDTLHNFAFFGNVSLLNGMSMIDVFKKQNFLKRKDRSCNTVWSTVGTTGNRKLKLTELYSATKFCQEEFYDGSLKDLRENPTLFRNLAMDILKNGTRADMLTNIYFGNVERPDDTLGVFNWNSFNGIVTHIGNYIEDGMLPSEQVMTALPDGEITPLQAYNALYEAYRRRSNLMKRIPKNMLEFTVDEAFADAYMMYLISTGVPSGNGPMFIQNGIPVLNFLNIPIYVESTFNPILEALNGGTEAHMLTLTIGSNFCFGTNKNYGGGANLDQAARLWYSDDDDEWKAKHHLVAGTEMKSPEHVVFGMTDIS